MMQERLDYVEQIRDYFYIPCIVVSIFSPLRDLHLVIPKKMLILSANSLQMDIKCSFVSHMPRFVCCCLECSLLLFDHRCYLPFVSDEGPDYLDGIRLHMNSLD